MPIDTLPLKRLLVRSPLEGLAKKARHVLEWPSRLKAPELAELFAEPGQVDEAMKRILRPDSNCVDVGCHIGSTLSLILKLAPKGHHAAFEPIPRKAMWLRQKFPEVDVHEVALSDVAGEVTFFEDLDRPGFSGLTKAKDARSRPIQVRCATLDDELKDVKIDFLKVDVEGAEIMVFKGASKTLQTSKPVITFESTPGAAERFGSTSKELYEYLVSQGYAIYLPKDYLVGAAPLSIKGFLVAHEYPFKAFNYIAIYAASVAA